jgi:HK97 family phage major capsid protein
MAGTLVKGDLFPRSLSKDLLQRVKGKSSLAKLSTAEPLEFNGTDIFQFSLDKEVDIVAEGGQKSSGGATIEPVSMVPIKFEYSMRVSDEFMRASAEAKIPYLQRFNEAFAKKLARGMDIAAMHGYNPRTASASLVVGSNSFDGKVTNTVTQAASDNNPNKNVEDAIALVHGAEYDVNGMAMAPAFRSQLAELTRTDGTPLFPELGWGAQPDVIRGLAVDTNSTVSFLKTGETDPADLAIVGDFQNMFRWGMASDIIFKVIETGNPDNDEVLGDLASRNQVLLRAEAYLGWAILDKAAFARILPNA